MEPIVKWREASVAKVRRNEFLELGKKNLLEAREHIRRGNSKVACACYLGSIAAFRQLKERTKKLDKQEKIELVISKAEKELYSNLSRIGRAALADSLKTAIRSANGEMLALTALFVIAAVD